MIKDDDRPFLEHIGRRLAAGVGVKFAKMNGQPQTVPALDHHTMIVAAARSLASVRRAITMDARVSSDMVKDAQLLESYAKALRQHLETARELQTLGERRRRRSEIFAATKQAARILTLAAAMALPAKAQDSGALPAWLIEVVAEAHRIAGFDGQPFDPARVTSTVSDRFDLASAPVTNDVKRRMLSSVQDWRFARAVLGAHYQEPL